ncbi:MAG: hypothetical protein AB7O24_31485 [Kofleriaceae bacterium]
MDIRFVDHPSFHRAAAGMVGAAASCGLALSPVTPLAPLVGGIAGIAVGASIAYRQAGWRMLSAGAASALVLGAPPSWTVLAAAAGILGLGLSINGPRGARGALSVALAAVIALVGMWCAIRITAASATAMWPNWAIHGAGAAAMSIVGVLAMLPRHVRLAIDPVRAAMARLPSTLDPEVKNLCDRSLAIWSAAKQRLGDADPGTNLVRDGALKVLEVAGNTATVKAGGPTEAELASRMTDLDQRIAAASDIEVKTQYQAARAALDDQKRYRDRITQGRERLIARMHNHVAALEKFQLAASGLQAERVASAGATSQLDELSRDVAASCEALAEVEHGIPVASDSAPAAVSG